jgi:hypothetical protein
MGTMPSTCCRLNNNYVNWDQYYAFFNSQVYCLCRISFVKGLKEKDKLAQKMEKFPIMFLFLLSGWGQQYRRQTISFVQIIINFVFQQFVNSASCPMWIEIQFPRPLQMLDEIMMEYADQIGDEEVRSFS